MLRAASRFEDSSMGPGMPTWVFDHFDCRRSRPAAPPRARHRPRAGVLGAEAGSAPPAGPRVAGPDRGDVRCHKLTRRLREVRPRSPALRRPVRRATLPSDARA